MNNPAAPIGTPQNPLIYSLPEDQGYMPSYDWHNPVLFDIFWLVFPTFGPFTAAAQLQQSVNVPNDADFEVRRIMYHFDLAAAALTQATSFVPNITIMLTDSGSGRNLMSAAAPLASIASAEASQSPKDLPWPKIFTRNSTITAVLTNFDAAQTTANVRLTLAGRKIFSA
ncbi:MAG: hypothetical protein ACYDAK_12865 [Candidatus Limnocylindrales bacterium]